MEITVDKLIVFCKNLEEYHSTQCKRYDDASGYTRSHIEAIRTNDARREEANSKFYHELKKILRKYQKIEQILKDIPYGNGAVVWRIQEVIEDES